MPCFRPREAWYARPSGGSKVGEVVFREPPASDRFSPIKLPCGSCDGCRAARSGAWALRCYHEASLHKRNCFVTLTYDDAHLPSDGSLVLRDVQLFIKRLRKRFCVLPRPEDGSPAADAIRFFLCGEYGSLNGRPHYHALLFNFDFEDKYFSRKTSAGDLCYESPVLRSLWGNGITELGSVSFASAAYVAGYIFKKVVGESAASVYGEKVDHNGVVGFIRKPEFVVMSRNLGIGAGWYDRFRSDVFPSDFCVVEGHKVPVPVFYSRRLALEDPALFSEVKDSRGSSNWFDRSAPRLAVAEAVAASRRAHLSKRSL